MWFWGLYEEEEEEEKEEKEEEEEEEEEEEPEDPKPALEEGKSESWDAMLYRSAQNRRVSSYAPVDASWRFPDQCCPKIATSCHKRRDRNHLLTIIQSA